MTADRPLASGPALQASSVRKRFKNKLALDGADMSVEAGHVTALVGPNGAGKTTLIRTWLAFERPDSGQVQVRGINPWKDRARALANIAYVPQKAAVFGGLTVADHLAMAWGLQRSFDRGYAQRRLEQLDIPLRQRADTLSGGQAAQLGLAVALGTRRNTLVLDEPLANLDALARREFLQVLLDAVAADGLTVLLSTHLVTDIEAACDRLAILGGGRVLLDCPIDDARKMHRLTDLDAPPADASLVGTFAHNRDLRPVALWRAVATSGASGEPNNVASLEEVVLGYLSAGRAVDAQRNR